LNLLGAVFLKRAFYETINYQDLSRRCRYPHALQNYLACTGHSIQKEWLN